MKNWVLFVRKVLAILLYALQRLWRNGCTLVQVLFACFTRYYDSVTHWCKLCFICFLDLVCDYVSGANGAHSVLSFRFVCIFGVCWVCLRDFGLLTSFRCVNKFWLWYVLVFFSVKNEFFLGFDFEDVICANFHGHICNQRIKIRKHKKFQSGLRYLAFGNLSIQY